MMQKEDMKGKNKQKQDQSRILETIDSKRGRLLFGSLAAAAAILVHAQDEKYFHLHKICALKIIIVQLK